MKHIIKRIVKPKLIGGILALGGIALGISKMGELVTDVKPSHPGHEILDRVDPEYSQTVLDLRQLLSIYHPDCPYPDRMEYLLRWLAAAEVSSACREFDSRGLVFDVAAWNERLKKLVKSTMCLPLRELQPDVTEKLELITQYGDDMMYNIEQNCAEK